MTPGRNLTELGQFLRTRRERIPPEGIGLPVGRRRRAVGLRREEVAALAGVSHTWYTYLEQGRDVNPSASVLDSLTRVLRLSPDERRYLYLLAGQTMVVAPAPSSAAEPALMREIVRLVGDIELPVYAANLYADVIAWNRAAAEWYTDFGQLAPERRNMLLWMLTAPQARERIVDWREDTLDVVARFRTASAARPWDQRFADLITMMGTASPEFTEWWSDHNVSDQHLRQRRLRLPSGEIRAVHLVVLRMTDSFNSVVLHVPAGADSAGIDPATLR